MIIRFLRQGGVYAYFAAFVALVLLLAVPAYAFPAFHTGFPQPSYVSHSKLNSQPDVSATNATSIFDSVTSVTAPMSEEVKPEASPAVVPSAKDPDAGDMPMLVEVRRPGESQLVVSSQRFAEGTSLFPQENNDRPKWSVAPGSVEWAQFGNYPKPGELSRLSAVINGHVVADGTPDVFADLHKVQQGDLVVVTFQSGDEYVFTVVDEPLVAPKDSPEMTQFIYGESPEVGRMVVLGTCDDEFGFRPTGERVANLAVRAVLIEE